MSSIFRMLGKLWVTLILITVSGHLLFRWFGIESPLLHSPFSFGVQTLILCTTVAGLALGIDWHFSRNTHWVVHEDRITVHRRGVVVGLIDFNEIQAVTLLTQGIMIKTKQDKLWRWRYLNAAEYKSSLEIANKWRSRLSARVPLPSVDC